MKAVACNVSPEEENQGMTIPQFSLRRLLVIVTIAGFFCLLPTLAAQGYLWALGPITAVAAAILFLILGAIFYGLTGGAVALMEATRRSDPPKRNG